MRTTIFAKYLLAFPSISIEMHENVRSAVDFSKDGTWIFSNGFLLYSLCNFSFFGPGCAPPHKGDSNKHFLEDFAIGIRILFFLEQTAIGSIPAREK